MSSVISYCFRPSHTFDDPPPPSLSPTNPNLTTYLYHTHLSFVSLTWSRSVLDDSRLCFSIDGEKVLQIRRLEWKFRGNEKVEVDGIPVQISWDVYNWLFEKHSSDGHAIFMFKFEEQEEDVDEAGGKEIGYRNLVNFWTQQRNWSGYNDLGKSFLSLSARSLGGSSSVAGKEVE
ncbi:hypothetical protein K1719_032105 [Acacia pycnantha]|nr:hypothetical protein K1719_032105 [Acacia pycnantha]